MTWKQDRETLRDYIRENKPEGQVATALYVLVSHMRGKLHMKYCNSNNPYENHRYKTTSELPEPRAKLVRSYGSSLDYYHKMIYIGSLEDQERWFFEIGALRLLPLEFEEISERVFAGYPEEKKDLPEVAVAV